MVGDGTRIGFHAGIPGGRETDRGSAPGEHSQDAATGGFHEGIGLKSINSGKMGWLLGAQKIGFFSKFP